VAATSNIALIAGRTTTVADGTSRQAATAPLQISCCSVVKRATSARVDTRRFSRPCTCETHLAGRAARLRAGCRGAATRFQSHSPRLRSAHDGYRGARRHPRTSMPAAAQQAERHGFDGSQPRGSSEIITGECPPADATSVSRLTSRAANIPANITRLRAMLVARILPPRHQADSNVFAHSGV